MHQIRRRRRSFRTVAALRQVWTSSPSAATVAREWSIESLDLAENGLLLTLAGEPGRARFELTCSSSPSSVLSTSATPTSSIIGRTWSFRSWRRPGGRSREALRNATEAVTSAEHLVVLADRGRDTSLTR